LKNHCIATRGPRAAADYQDESRSRSVTALYTQHCRSTSREGGR
jgi:hypothetical protein